MSVHKDSLSFSLSLTRYFSRSKQLLRPFLLSLFRCWHLGEQALGLVQRTRTLPTPEKTASSFLLMSSLRRPDTQT